MSVLYRALWRDEAVGNIPAYLESIANETARWCFDDEGVKTPIPGQHTFKAANGNERSVTYRMLDGENGPAGFEYLTRDREPGNRAVWTTAIRAIEHKNAVEVLVESQMDSDDSRRHISVGRPRVVRKLLQAANKPMLGHTTVLHGVYRIDADEIPMLRQLLADEGRTLPFVVCSARSEESGHDLLTHARKIANRIEGIAVVVTLDSQAVTRFRDELGDLAIWGGGIRIYSPTPVLDPSDGWRHRYYLGEQIAAETGKAIDRIVYAVSQASARRRVPEVFRVFTDQSPAGPEYVRVSELESERENWEFELIEAQDARSEAEKLLAQANGHLERLKAELLQRGMVDLLWATQVDHKNSIPDSVQDMEEAVLAARSYLSEWLSVPEGVEQDLEDLDAAVNANSWGNTTWLGLRALAGYADDRHLGWSSGGFWEWCLEGRFPTWPASPKKLAMTESETVQNNKKLASARVFPVDRKVDPSGKVMMLSHLKIAEGGGSLAPRVYFYDDTDGKTRKVHVGFIGPHSLLPNKSTN